MTTENKELMRQAREALEGKWGMAVGAAAIYIILTSSASVIFQKGGGSVSFVITAIITGPMALGFAIFSLKIARSQEARISMMFEGFNKFGKALAAYFLMVIFVILWLLLLIIPGIIAAISYSMTFYIIADDDSIDAMDAIDKSKEMMQGYKLKYFYLCLRFIGWALLCILTLGIGFLLLIPYVQVTMAGFYDDVRQQYALKQNV
jgi:uncharacterized membrane protein